MGEMLTASPVMIGHPIVSSPFGASVAVNGAIWGGEHQLNAATLLLYAREGIGVWLANSGYAYLVGGGDQIHLPVLSCYPYFWYNTRARINN